MATPPIRIERPPQSGAPHADLVGLRFDHDQDLLLVVELKDGSRVAGYYGKRSHSGYGSRTRDLFLEERWDVSADDGSISRPPAERHSVGIWIGADEIRLVDHYAMSDEHQRDIEERSPERT